MAAPDTRQLVEEVTRTVLSRLQDMQLQIVVGVSNRHAHLIREDLATLFGLGPLRSVEVTERYAGGLVKSLTATGATGATRTITRTSEGWRKDLGVPGAWVSGISGR